ncbi:hypothetical protein HD806DRAFT_108493 [Xylariaceae sp. AK1471]|nr:hypothetical protein HD806DRAFT_108493 [Xylariaceae sp. AK1471]
MASPRYDNSTPRLAIAPASSRLVSSPRHLGGSLTSLDRSHAPPSVFPPLSQPNTSSVSLVSSTAQGRPIPLSDANAADRTTALRELSRSQPIGRHRPPSTTTGTYSQPVLVRTYSGPSPTSSSTKASSAARRDAHSAIQARPNASSSSVRRGRHGFAVTLVRPLVHKKPSPGDDMKLPPIEAFTFKSIMAEIEHDIGADLDRIADICARSRYSLSNQYEIHVAPHGSGDGFVQGGPASTSTTTPRHHDHGGPTLQAISIDDEHASTSHGRRVAVRRKSAAYGTLETIISSSRSSDEDRSKRKSAAEIAAQVRGRVPHPSPEESGSAHSTEAQASSELHDERTRKTLRARPTLAAAILDHSRAQTHHRPNPPPRGSGTTLVGEPAVPETSHSHLVSTTIPEGLSREDRNIGSSAKEQTSVSVSKSVAAAAIAIPEQPKDQSSLLGGFRFSIPWKGTAVTDTSSTEQKPGRTKSYAEGTLRQLLRITESSGSRGGKFTDGADGVRG